MIDIHHMHADLQVTQLGNHAMFETEKFAASVHLSLPDDSAVTDATSQKEFQEKLIEALSPIADDFHLQLVIGPVD